MFDSGFNFSFPLSDLNYVDPSVFNPSLPDLSIDTSVTFEVYDPLQYDLNYDFTNIDLLDYSNSSEPSFNLDTYDFSDPEINTTVLSFTPTQIDFSPSKFDFISLSIDSNSITFQFEPSKFEPISAKFDFLSEIDSTDIKLAFEEYNFDFDSKFSFDTDAVTIGTTGNNTITFNYDPDSFNFEAANLFKANANLFDYKFLDNDISLINKEIPFVEYNASDYRALEYAFEGDEVFDPEYYLATNVIPDGQNPFTDYMENGYKAGRDPHALFDVDYYLLTNPGFKITGIEPFSQYMTEGFKQQRNPHALFNGSYYYQQNTDVADAGMNPLLHYVLFGDSEYHENRDPNAVFDSSYYNQMNPHVAESDMSALEHYWLFGWRESLPENPQGNPNRNPNPFMSSRDYFEFHDDVRVASYTLPSANPVQHLIEFGIIEGRATHKMLNSNNKIAKFTQLITPDSDPQKISNLQKNMKDDGYELKLTNGNFEINQVALYEEGWDPVGKAFEKALEAAGAAFFVISYSVYQAGVVFREYVDNWDWEPIVDQGFGGFTDSSDTFGFGYNIIPLEGSGTNVTSISYGDPSLAELLLPFPGQTESEIAVEIFTTPKIDGVEDFTIFPEEGIFLPSPTGFPKGNETLEALLNDGLFLGGTESPEGAFVLASKRDGDYIAYNPKILGNSLNSDWNNTIAAKGELEIDLENSGTLFDREIIIPARTPNAVRDKSRLSREQTRGLLIDPNGNTIQLKSVRSKQGDVRSPATIQTETEILAKTGTISNAIRDSFNHVEGNAASIVRQLNLPSATVVINHETGPCFRCVEALPQILNPGQTLEVIHTPDGGKILFVDLFRGGQTFDVNTDRSRLPIDF